MELLGRLAPIRGRAEKLVYTVVVVIGHIHDPAAVRREGDGREFRRQRMIWVEANVIAACGDLPAEKDILHASA